VEDIYKCLDNASPYYKLLFGAGETIVASVVIFEGFELSSQKNPQNIRLKTILKLKDYVLLIEGILLGAFFVADGLLYFLPGVVNAHPRLSKLLSSQYVFRTDKITTDHAWKTLFKFALDSAQVFKIFGGTTLTLHSLQQLGQKLQIPYLRKCLDGTIEGIQYSCEAFIRHVLPAVSTKYARALLGFLLFLLGAGTSVDGWRRLLTTQEGFAKDLLFNLEIGAGSLGMCAGLDVLKTALGYSYVIKDIPFASFESSLGATLLKYDNSMFERFPRLSDPLINYKTLANTSLTLIFESNAAIRVLQALTRPFGVNGEKLSSSIEFNGSNLSWGSVFSLISYAFIQRTLDFYVNQPFTNKNELISSVTCGAALLSGYIAWDLFLGKRPNGIPVDKVGRALFSGAIITGVISLYVKFFT
jgi:hypothetical protein